MQLLLQCQQLQQLLLPLLLLLLLLLLGLQQRALPPCLYEVGKCGVFTALLRLNGLKRLLK